MTDRTILPFYHVTEDRGWSYVVTPDGTRERHPWRYRWEAEEYVAELNAKLKQKTPSG